MHDSYDAPVRLTDWERDRLEIFNAAELARRHRAAGLKLNAPVTAVPLSRRYFLR